MTDQIVAWVEALMSLTIFYPVLGLIVISDSLFPLIPSEAILTLAGAWAGSQGVPNVWIVIQVAVIAAVIGDNICYLMGTRLIGVVERIPDRSTRGKTVEWVRKNIQRNAATTIIVARFIPWARWFMTITLGSVRYPWLRFFIYDTIGVIIWATQVTFIGYLGGWLLQDYPLLGMLLGITLGTVIGLSIQVLQGRFFRWRDARQEATDSAPKLPN
ncbi:DedA family protein [Corynebacterium alimapuense]|uniref:VTT domain-containing protein n=1 Tax=Corynebacterium alimapuense TaxID=1576874 RepID=A0A3M8K8Y6_9CORY|nr:DedA family protein [Corynebacterium alimapuense]RNE49002.1 hypothetical protein C5L39_06885 [Corynebacterium alimapuense]